MAKYNIPAFQVGNKVRLRNLLSNYLEDFPSYDKDKYVGHGKEYTVIHVIPSSYSSKEDRYVLNEFTNYWSISWLEKV